MEPPFADSGPSWSLSMMDHFTPLEPPVPASGWRRFRNRVINATVCAIVPGFVRKRFGYWTWNEVLKSSKRKYGYDPRWQFGKERHPPDIVARLVAWGIPFPKTLPAANSHPWPASLEDRTNTSNWNNRWEMVPPREIIAWAMVWKSHPQGQHCLDQVLIGAAGMRHPRLIDWLLRCGANPNAKFSSQKNALVNLFYSPSSENENTPEDINKIIPAWAAFQQVSQDIDWTPVIQEAGWYRQRKRTAEDFQKILDAKLPLPPVAVLECWGQKTVNDPEASGYWGGNEPRANVYARALAFLMAQCPPLTTPEGRGKLLAVWLKTSRIGDAPSDHQAMKTWLDVITDNGQLPVLPVNEASWGHVMLQSPFCECFPIATRDWLCAPDPLFKIVDDENQTVAQRINEFIAKSHSQSRDEGLDALNAWARTRFLDAQLPAAAPSETIRPKPRF